MAASLAVRPGRSGDTGPAVPAAFWACAAATGTSVAVDAAQGLIWFNSTGATQTVTLTSAPYDYDVITLAPSQAYEFVLPRPGVYGYVVTPAGHASGTEARPSIRAVRSSRLLMSGSGTADSSALV